MATVSNDVRERVLSYISHQATKGPERIKEAVQKGHDQLFNLIAGLSEEQATFKPSADDWSVLELMAHVVTAKRGVARICDRLARGETVSDFGGEGEEQDGVTRDSFASLSAARQAMEEAHQELLSFIDRQMTEANVDARFHHFLFGELSCLEWAVFQRVHDGDHTQQIEQIMAAPGFPKA